MLENLLNNWNDNKGLPDADQDGGKQGMHKSLQSTLVLVTTKEKGKDKPKRKLPAEGQGTKVFDLLRQCILFRVRYMYTRPTTRPT